MKHLLRDIILTLYYDYDSIDKRFLKDHMKKKWKDWNQVVQMNTIHSKNKTKVSQFNIKCGIKFLNSYFFLQSS